MRVNMEYTQLRASRFSRPSGKVNVANNSNISSISREGDVVNVSFSFTSTYNPSIGEIKIDGNMMLSDLNDGTERDLLDWEVGKGKDLPPALATRMHNTIISNCIVEATLLSREIMLPPPTPIPKIKIQEKKVDHDNKLDSRYSDMPDYIR